MMMILVVIIRNIKGFRHIDLTEKKYRFCGNNPTIDCTPPYEGGEFNILFKINGINATVSSAQFVIHDILGLVPTVTAFNGMSSATVTIVPVSGGNQYTISNAVDKIVVQCISDNRYDSRFFKFLH